MVNMVRVCCAWWESGTCKAKWKITKMRIKNIYNVIIILREINLKTGRWLTQRVSKKIRAGEGNGNPLQYSCLENPMDQEAWWATDHGVAKRRTRLSDSGKTCRSVSLALIYRWDGRGSGKEVTGPTSSCSRWWEAGSPPPAYSEASW